MFRYILVLLISFPAYLFSGNNVELIKLNDSTYIHRSYFTINGNEIPSNGLIILSNSKALIIDTPWNDAQARNLMKKIKNELKAEANLLIITHAHNDRIGGIKAMKDRKVHAISSPLTAKLAAKQGFATPDPDIKRDTSFKFGNRTIKVEFPGKGHTEDNIIVTLPLEKTIFGGCFIKSAQSTDLGNIEEAFPKEWIVAINKIIKKYKDFTLFIPGHGEHGGIELVNKTRELLESHLMNKSIKK